MSDEATIDVGTPQARPKVRPAAHRASRWWWALWVPLILIALAGIGVAVFAAAWPDVWKAHTGRNGFEALDGNGVTEIMAWAEPELLAGDVNDEPHNFSTTISDDGKTMIFARRSTRGDMDLYITRRDEAGDDWAEPKALELLNTVDNETTPELVPASNRLIFASDRVDGFGGYDLWVTTLGEEGWTEPVNLGPRVNSEFNERGPCMGLKRNQLFLVSDRPKRSMRTGDRRRYWEALRDGIQEGDYDIFCLDKIVFPRSSNPLRDSRYRESVIVDLGGSIETERAVRAALDWMAKNQEPDGRWDCAKHGGGKGEDIAATSMAALSFLGWGARHDQEDTDYHEPMKKAVAWLLAEGTKRKGDFSKGVSHGMYGHGAAAIALAETYLVTKDPAIEPVLKQAIDIIIKAQHRKLGGWRYTTTSNDCDTSVVGWQILALRSARLAGIEVPDECFTLCAKWMDRASSGEHKGLYGYQNGSPKDAMTAEGMFIQQILGASPPEARQIESAQYLIKNLPVEKAAPDRKGKRKRRGGTNLYYWYYGCLAMYQQQGPMWTEWNDAVKPLLLDLQAKSGPNAGTWEPGAWRQSGRVVGTAFATLSLEVYYRYLPMYNTEWQGKKLQGDKKSTSKTVKELVAASRPAARAVSHTTPLLARWVEALRSPFTEGALTFSAQGDWAYFSSNRSGGTGGYDIYRARVVQGIIQSRPENAGDPINSADHELSPELTADGQELIFCSNRPHDGQRLGLLYHTRLTPISDVQKALAWLDANKWWVLGLLLGLAALIALLIWYLTSENRERLSLLARCLLCSAALHAALLVVLSIYMLAQELIKPPGGDPQEISINADALASEKLALEIREQVTELQNNPQIVRVVAQRDPMPLPNMASDQIAPAVMARSTVPIERPDLNIKTTEVTVAEPVQRPTPKPMKVSKRITFKTEIDLEMKPETPTNVAAKSTDVPVVAPFSAGSPVPTMSEVADAPLREDATPAKAAVPSPTAAAKDIETEWRTQTAESAAKTGAARSRVARFKGFTVPTPEADLEARPGGGRKGGTATPGATAQFSSGRSGATMASGPAGTALTKNAAPAGSAVGTLDAKPGQLAASGDLPGEGRPRLRGPGVELSRHIPRLPIGDTMELEAPADRKSNYFARQLANRKNIGRLGGSDETEAAIGRAIDWLTANQEPDGRWDCARHGGVKGHDNATTGLAMLVYYGWNIKHTAATGESQLDITRRKAITKALNWLIQRVGADGDLTGGTSNGMYDQGIATMALAEAYGLTRDPALYEPLRRTTNFIIRAQSKEHGGWRYGANSRDGDTSVVGWQVMALTSARMAGVRVPEEPFHRAQRWLAHVADPRNKGRYGYTKGNNVSPTMSAEAMFCQQLLGVKPTDERMVGTAEYLKINLPSMDKAAKKARNANYYYWYYGCLSMFQHQGPAWETWNEQMKKVFLATQERVGKDAGSWPPNGRWTGKSGGGRVMSTAMSALSLEVYYRYLPMYHRRPSPLAKDKDKSSE